MSQKMPKAIGCTFLVLLGAGAFARETNAPAPPRNSDEIESGRPAGAFNLDGNWRCSFLNASNPIEKQYYSWWTFNSGNHEVKIFYSPVHKGFSHGYGWEGNQLVFSSLADPKRKTVSTFKSRLQTDGALIIEDPRLNWKGWRCHRQTEISWPSDGLKFLDYGFYPWLKGLVEDSLEITRYQNPKQYDEILKGMPR